MTTVLPVHPVDEAPRSGGGRQRAPRRGPILPARAAYALAVLLPLVLTLVVDGLDNPSYRFGSAFFAAIAVVAALGGTGPAVVAGVTSTAGFWFAGVVPSGTFEVHETEGFVSLGVFMLSVVLILWISWQRDLAAERTRLHERRYRRLADTGLIGIIFWDTQGRISDANEAFLSMVGYTTDDVASGQFGWTTITAPDDLDADRARLAELTARGYNDPYEKDFVRKDGQRVPVLVGTAFLEGSTEHGVSYVLDLTERVRMEAEREALLASERAARDDAEVANRRLALVASASASVMAVLEPDAVIARLTEAVVPELGQVVSVFVPEGDLLHRALTVHHTRPDLAEALTRRYPVVPRSDSPVAEAFRTGRITPMPAPDLRHPVAIAPDLLTVIDAMRLADGVAIPLQAGTDVLGVVVLTGTVERPLEGGAVQVATTIVERAAVALQKAQTFEAERQVASLMQRALLPDSDRTIEHHDVGTCYVPAAVGREIGGDWWDIVPLADGRVAIVVGDVSGHGVHLAPSMAKMRHSISGVLTHGASPAEAASAASRLLRVSRPGAYATAFVGVYDPVSHELSYSRAGHPPPLVITPDGVTQLDHPGGTLLGLDVSERQETTVVLPDHFELVAFTDGLVETPGVPYDDGVQRVIEAVRDLPHDVHGQERAEQLVATVVGTTGSDDVCVVMVRPLPEDRAPSAELD